MCSVCAININGTYIIQHPFTVVYVDRSTKMLKIRVIFCWEGAGGWFCAVRGCCYVLFVACACHICRRPIQRCWEQHAQALVFLVARLTPPWYIYICTVRMSSCVRFRSKFSTFAMPFFTLDGCMLVDIVLTSIWSCSDRSNTRWWFPPVVCGTGLSMHVIVSQQAHIHGGVLFTVETS